MSRHIEGHYDDPVSLLWLRAARELGLEVRFSDEVFASYDGAGRLTLCKPQYFDPDDSLAQLIFHELCHALVAGDRAFDAPDWGMKNTDDRDLLQEHACHRLQAALADRHGLRALFAVTTEHRPYWDALPVDPLGPGDDPSIPIARQGYVRATAGPWREPLERALGGTRKIAEAVRPLAPANSLWARTQALHPAGFPLPQTPRGRCGDCAWSYTSRARLRCRQTKRLRRAGTAVDAAAPGCVRFEERLDAAACHTCGACCREAFDVVEVSTREPFARKHPQLVQRDGFGPHVPRHHGRCVALAGHGDEERPYRCVHYEDRPRSCREFAVGGDACLQARRKLGLSA